MSNSITKDELKQNTEQYVIIDVREIDEFEKGNIENSQHMPLGLVIRNVKQGKIGIISEKSLTKRR